MTLRRGHLGTAKRLRGVSRRTCRTRKCLVGESPPRRNSSPLGCRQLPSGGARPWKADSASAFRQSPQCFRPSRDRTLGPIRAPIPTFPPAAVPVRSLDGRTGKWRHKAQRVQTPRTRPQPRLRTCQEPPAQPLSCSRPPRLRRVPEKRLRSASGGGDPRSPQVMHVLSLAMQARLTK